MAKALSGKGRKRSDNFFIMAVGDAAMICLSASVCLYDRCPDGCFISREMKARDPDARPSLVCGQEVVIVKAVLD